MSDRLNLRGSRNVDPGQTLGPDNFGAYYAIVSADYDAATDVTAVTLRPIPPAELMERNKTELEAMAQRARIRELFA